VNKTAKDVITLRGKVIEVLPNTQFMVGVDINGQQHIVMSYISGKMRMHYIKLQRGDEVRLEVSPYDLKKGRITYRF